MQCMLDIVSEFARNWRLDFVNDAAPERTKSHVIIVNPQLLSEIPTWYLSGQQLVSTSSTEHLGVCFDENMSTSPHIDYTV